jgi:non-specific serine/threonine protein kinase
LNEEFKIISTGIQGLDEMLNGGFPERYVVLISGGPGSGKTIFSLQFLYQGIMKGEKGVYVSLDENVNLIKRNMKFSFNWDFDKLEKEKKVEIIDWTPIRHVPDEVKIGSVTVRKREFSIISLIDIIKKSVSRIGAKRIVVDPITTLVFQFQDISERRFVIMDLLQCLTETGCTSILSSEFRMSNLEHDFQPEEYLCQGVILFQSLITGGSFSRAVHIEKMRGVSHDNQPRPYKITNNGITFYPNEKIL